MRRFGARRIDPGPKDKGPALDLNLPASFNLEGVSEQDALYAIWRTGIGLELLLHSKQLEIALEFFALPALSDLFLLIARRWGKTTLALWIAEKIARTIKNAVIRFAYPTKEQAKTIIIPAWEQLTDSCPAELRWQNREATDGCWYLPISNARLYMAGTDTKDQVDRLRGPRSNFTVIDEPGSHGCDLEYLVDSILSPQLLTTGGKMLFITTPPVSMAHPSKLFINEARAKDTLRIQTIHDVPEEVMTEDMKWKWCLKLHRGYPEEEVRKIYEGKAEGAPAWEREAMCRLVSDKGFRVTPEFSKFTHVGQRPTLRYRDRYVLGDAGFSKDYFALLFCEVDWAAGILWVCREWVKKRVATEEMVKQALAIEAELWPTRVATEHLTRIVDGDPRTISDMCKLKYAVRFAGKSEGSEKMAKPLSNRLHAGNVMVDKACPSLIAQLDEGVFKMDPLTGQKVDFQRSEEHGHLDALAALAQGIPHIVWNHNPAPSGYLFDRADSVPSPDVKVATGPMAKALAHAISLKSRFRRG